MTHQTKTDNATLETLLMDGVVFYPERLDGIVVADITPPAAKATAQTGTDGNS